ncbi:MAG TPA: DUF1570 domain-containing protein [Pirellulaceae bacterium]|nr:DUF1570 domain-containing protein [Pirellulaceae bacterium]
MSRGRELNRTESRWTRRELLRWCAVGVVAPCAAALRAPAPALAAQRWFDERTIGPLSVHADYALQTHEQLLGDLGGLQSDLTRSLGVQEAREPVHLFLFQKRTTYQAYLREYFPRVPYRRALYIKERGPGMVFAFHSTELDVDLRHESTHALLHASVANVPLWLDEGLAEYFEVTPEQRASENPYLGTVRWHARFGQTPRLEDLEAITDLNRLGPTEYRHAWAWVHFLLHGPPEGRDELARYLTDLDSDSGPARLSGRLRRRWPELDRDFASHFKRWK